MRSERTRPATPPLPAAAVAGLLAAALAGLAGLAACAGDEDDPGEEGQPTATATTTQSPGEPEDSPTGAPDVELIEIEITDGSVDPPPGRVTVDQGTTVRIVVTSDQPDEVHLHGYDRTAEVGPDEQGVIEIVADQTGQFELETHENHLVLLQLLVQ